MHGPLLAIGLLTTLLSALMTWAAAARYGRNRAMIVPLLALASIAALIWRASGMDMHRALTMTSVAVVLAGASVAGALIGVALARWRGK